MAAADQAQIAHDADDSDIPRDILAAWGRDTLGIEVSAATLALRRFRGGHSNRTYAIETPSARLILRMPPPGTVAARAHDISREYRVLRAVAPKFPFAPSVLGACDDASVLGAPFYVMEAIEGMIIRKEFPEGYAPDPAAAARLAEAMVSTLAAMHAVPTAGDAMQRIGNPEGYVSRQLASWRARYDDAATDDVPAALRTFEWLDAHLPREDEDALVHNDFKFDNVVFRGGTETLVGVLDWELATRGAPLTDLGGMLAAWVEPSDPLPLQLMRLAPTNTAGMPTRAELARMYGEISGRDVSAWRAFHVFGLARLGVVAQQLYARFVRGDTSDPRLSALRYGIPALFDFCEAQIALAEAD